MARTAITVQYLPDLYDKEVEDNLTYTAVDTVNGNSVAANGEVLLLAWATDTVTDATVTVSGGTFSPVGEIGDIVVTLSASGKTAMTRIPTPYLQSDGTYIFDGDDANVSVAVVEI